MCPVGTDFSGKNALVVPNVAEVSRSNAVYRKGFANPGCYAQVLSFLRNIGEGLVQEVEVIDGARV